MNLHPNFGEPKGKVLCKMELTIRRAKREEASGLSELAFQSEAVWGFDERYMASFRSRYRVTEEFIGSNPTYVLDDGESIAGFYSLAVKGRTASLEYFYIKPGSMGRGYGRRLWNHMIKLCREMGLEKVELVTSPEAAGFYIKMGARSAGRVESKVKKGRMVPKLIYDII
ncbi:MAG TPA: GNAT family N-acetyltransferase [Bacillota bacterium]|jgi:ribosomal protein S18 acetylase RimI-like enzyme|nr:GNAT family N-acetyltransferase [Bacillota bacterium]